MEQQRSQPGKELQNFVEGSENDGGFIEDTAKFAIPLFRQTTTGDFFLRFDFVVSAITDKIQTRCFVSTVGVRKWRRTMESTNRRLLFKEGLKDSKCLLLFCGGAIFNDTMKFSSQEGGVCFLRFEFEERRR